MDLGGAQGGGQAKQAQQGPVQRISRLHTSPGGSQQPLPLAPRYLDVEGEGAV